MLTDMQRAALAARLRQGRRPAPAAGADPVVALGGSGAAAFALPAVGGSVHEYAPLAQALDGVWRVAGIPAAGLHPGSTPATDLATMATRYAAMVARAQPAGPYRLLGWSMGGVLAYETARRLAADGAEVALVALIDAPYRTVTRYADSAAGLTALFVADALRGAGHPLGGAGHPPESSGDAARGAGHPPDRGADAPDRQLARLAERLAPGPDERAALTAELARRHDVFVAHTTALAGYLPDGPLDAAAVLVHAAGSPDSTADWARMFRRGARVAHVPAGHYECLRPPAVARIAAAIRAAHAAGSETTKG